MANHLIEKEITAFELQRRQLDSYIAGEDTAVVEDLPAVVPFHENREAYGITIATHIAHTLVLSGALTIEQARVVCDVGHTAGRLEWERREHEDTRNTVKYASVPNPTIASAYVPGVAGKYTNGSETRSTSSERELLSRTPVYTEPLLDAHMRGDIPQLAPATPVFTLQPQKSVVAKAL